jgi:hypothetical protein
MTSPSDAAGEASTPLNPAPVITIPGFSAEQSAALMAIMGELRPAAPTSQSDKQKFPEPDKFDSTDRTKLKLFLGQLHTKFKGEKAKFSTQKHRILYTVSLLRGVLQKMAINLYDEDDDDYP